MTKKGLDTAKSAVQIRGIVKNLIAPNKQLKDALKQVAQAEGLADTSTLSLQATLEGLNQVVKGDAESMNKLFPDVRALNGVLTLTGQNAAGASSDLMAMANSANAAAEAFQELADTDMQKLAKFNANMEQIKMTIGEGILPTIAKWAEGMNELISSGEFLKRTMGGIFRNIEDALPEFLSGTATFRKLFGKDIIDETFGALGGSGATTPAEEEAEAKRLARKGGSKLPGPAKAAVKASLGIQSALDQKSGAGLALTNLQNVGGNLGSVSRVNKGEMLLKTQVDLQKTLVSQVTLLNNKMKTGNQSNRIAR
jgi:hypothetical protein